MVFTDPKPKKRPKVYRWSTVNPSLEDEQILAALVKKHPECPVKPLKGQIRVILKFYKTPPKATPNWKKPLMDKEIIRPNINPDLDNYVKLVLDAMNGILWEDDRFIVECHSAKYYSTIKSRIEIYVDTIPEIKYKKDADKIGDIKTKQLDDFF